MHIIRKYFEKNLSLSLYQINFLVILIKLIIFIIQIYCYFEQQNFQKDFLVVHLTFISLIDQIN
jgi:hypothetical protein